jgi:hypothetical protein
MMAGIVWIITSMAGFYYMLQHCHYLINLWSTAMRKRKKIIPLATNAFHR